LPRWRGAAPIQRAILEGDTETGITIMQMDEGLDTGPMLYKVTCPIHANDTSEVLHDRLAELGAQAIIQTLEHLSEIKPEQQDDNLATYAHKIKKEEGALDWNLSAKELILKIHAFNPWPVAYFDSVRVWDAELVNNNISKAISGTILKTSSRGIDVATGDGVLRLLKLQFPGGKVLSAADILNSRQNDFAIGKILRSS
jgi:methionyl-tRNA formyltransferase